MNKYFEGLEILENKYPLLAKSAYSREESDEILYLSNYLEDILEITSLNMEGIIDAYARSCFEFLTLQNKFQQTGTYLATNQPDLVAKLYSKNVVMENYLLGLLCTYFYWENHYFIFNFFVREFNSQINAIKSPKIMEIGVGHGLFASYLLDYNKDTTYLGVDISPASLKFTSDIFSQKFQNRFTLINEDATSSNFNLNSKFDFSICCEVLEHVEDPLRLLLNIKNNLKETGLLFISTVCNLEAIDHIYLFRNPEEIRLLVEKAGFQIIMEKNFEVPGSTKELIQSNYVAILSLIPN
jgi:SAM-dependent methyltransferase